MTLDEIKVKADLFFEFPTKNKDHVTTTSALLFASECCKDADVNADWLSMAHELCTDYGVDQGHISQRLLILRRKLVDMQTSLAGRTYFHSDAQVELQNKRLFEALNRIADPEDSENPQWIALEALRAEFRGGIGHENG